MMTDYELQKYRQEIGDYLRAERKKRGISKYKICKDADFPNLRPIDNIESGRGYTVDTLLRYLNTIKISLHFRDV